MQGGDFQTSPDFRELLLINLYSNETAFCVSNNCISQLSETLVIIFQNIQNGKKIGESWKL